MTIPPSTETTAHSLDKLHREKNVKVRLKINFCNTFCNTSVYFLQFIFHKNGCIIILPKIIKNEDTIMYIGNISNKIAPKFYHANTNIPFEPEKTDKGFTWKMSVIFDSAVDIKYSLDKSFYIGEIVHGIAVNYRTSYFNNFTWRTSIIYFLIFCLIYHQKNTYHINVGEKHLRHLQFYLSLLLTYLHSL